MKEMTEAESQYIAEKEALAIERMNRAIHARTCRSLGQSVEKLITRHCTCGLSAILNAGSMEGKNL